MTQTEAQVIAEAIMRGFERVIDKVAGEVARHDSELAEIRDELLALTNRIEAATRQRLAAVPEPVEVKAAGARTADEWADPYALEGVRRGRRCESRWPELDAVRCVLTHGHEGPHRYTSGADGRSVEWRGA